MSELRVQLRWRRFLAYTHMDEQDVCTRDAFNAWMESGLLLGDWWAEHQGEWA